jgi:metal-sulfur cluster biosynthetic enzyme
MQLDTNQLRKTIEASLEAIIDPCSRAAGAPAGLVSMGLVGKIEIEPAEQGADVRVTLYITEPGCMMGALFQLTAQKQLASLPGIASATVDMDYGHVWTPEEMTLDYRARLSRYRAAQREHMKSLQQGKVGEGN